MKVNVQTSDPLFNSVYCNPFCSGIGTQGFTTAFNLSLSFKIFISISFCPLRVITLNSCWSDVYKLLLKNENVIHEIYILLYNINIYVCTYIFCNLTLNLCLALIISHVEPKAEIFRNSSEHGTVLVTGIILASSMIAIFNGDSSDKTYPLSQSPSSL